MTNPVKTYRFPPTWDYTPDGPLALGTVLSSIKGPLLPLLISPVTTTPQPGQAAAQPEPQQQHRIYNSTKRNVSYTTSASNQASVSLFASFAAPLLGIGPDASTTVSRDTALTQRFARVDTREWYPSLPDLRARIDSPAVTRFLTRSRAWTGKDVYIVTGVKVAFGASVESSVHKGVEGELEVSVDPGTIGGGIPGVVEFGPGIGGGRKTGVDVGWETSGDGEDNGFVWAYKVQKVKVKRKKGEVVDVQGQEYVRGATYSLEEDTDTEKKEVFDIEVDADEGPREGDEEGITVVGGDDDAEEFRLVPVER